MIGVTRGLATERTTWRATASSAPAPAKRSTTALPWASTLFTRAEPLCVWALGAATGVAGVVGLAGATGLAGTADFAGAAGFAGTAGVAGAAARVGAAGLVAVLVGVAGPATGASAAVAATTRLFDVSVTFTAPLA